MATTKQAEILFICGSPRSHTSVALLELLEKGAHEAGARSRRFLLSKKHIDPCTGCGYCEKTGTCILVDKKADTGSKDDYLELLDALEHADALAIVAPLFFAGPPAQLKALYDRLQPFWSRKYILKQEQGEKRPAQIFILGGGGDAHGYEPLVTISRSALAVAGFSIEKVQNFIGFKHARDIAPLPTEEEAAQMAFGELAHLRKAAALQREFEKRALAAGSAFARFATHSLVKRELEAELEVVEEEMAELNAELPAPAPRLEESLGSEPLEIVNHLDSGFEALKKSSRAAKASGAEKAVAEAKADVVGEEAQEVQASAGQEPESTPDAAPSGLIDIYAEDIDLDSTDNSSSAQSTPSARLSDNSESDSSKPQRS